ncbi:MAG TPA: ABC transporter substrate-binding protein [Geminicoccaceae bacterium]|nr:ABC transporter substrate-binding protein [Geminicoccus sp.]HMU53111.1 ABC transporter substrate-binding protein [Geminicoccaceae bacterium]
MRAWTPSRHRRPDRRGFLLGAAGLLVATSSAPAGADENGARQFVQDVGDRTVAALRRAGSSNQQRLDELVGLLNTATDLDLVGRLVLGQYWRTATDGQRAEYTRLFKELVVKSMADRLNTYGGETFQITTAKPVDQRDTVVSTRIFRPGSGGQPIAVDWRVRQLDGRYSIIDIVAEGVSMVVTQRSEVASVVSQKGMDGLIQTMRERLEGRA